MIRPFKKQDLETIMDIGNRAWQPIYDNARSRFGNELFQQLTPEPKTGKGLQVKSHCDKHPDWVMICEEEGRIVGFITFFLDYESKIAEIGNNAVDSECGLRGIGQQMYSAVLEHFKKEGMLNAKVKTGLDDAHAPARRAYERAGFNIKTEDITYFKSLTE